MLFLGSVMTTDLVHKVGHSLACQILFKIVMRAVITSSQPAWTSSAGMLSTPADEGWGDHPLCLSGNSSVLMDLHWPCDCTAQSSTLPIGSISICRSSVRHFPERSWTICSFPLFHTSQVFHQLVCPFTVVLPQVFFNLTTLFSYPVFFSFFHAPLDVVVLSALASVETYKTEQPFLSEV